MIRLDLHGSPHEIGRRHGMAAAAVIHDRFKVWCRFPVKPEQTDTVLQELIRYLSNTFPAVVEEMRGMAEGAGLSVRDAQLYNLFSAVNHVLHHTCSNVAFRRTDRGPMLGKNTDLGENDDRYLELKRVRPTEGHAFVAYSYGGTTWAQGLNERGLATGGSSVSPRDSKASATGLSDCILTRLVLQYCANVDEVVALFAKHPFVGKGLNMIVMDATGDTAVIEAAPGRHAVRRIEGDTLFCTNFYVSGNIEMQPNAAYLANARGRYDIFTRNLSGAASLERRAASLERRAAPLTFDFMKALLRHHEEPVSMCQHVKGGMNSVLSYIAVPSERALWFTEGHPCCHEYERFAL